MSIMGGNSFFKKILRILLPMIALETAHAGEITSLEWNILGDLKVTYAVGKSGQMIQVHCTALNEEQKPVGGGFAYTRGGVALVNVEVPSKYQNTNKIGVVCKP
jgi:hypothetical protein